MVFYEPGYRAVGFERVEIIWEDSESIFEGRVVLGQGPEGQRVSGRIHKLDCEFFFPGAGLEPLSCILDIVAGDDTGILVFGAQIESLVNMFEVVWDGNL